MIKSVDSSNNNIFEVAKETINENVISKIKDDILVFNNANNETKNEMFKIASQKARVIEHYGAILYETANNIADQLDESEKRLSVALNSGELSKESIDKMNSSEIVSGNRTSNRLKKELNAKLMSRGLKPLNNGDKVCIIRNQS